MSSKLAFLKMIQAGLGLQAKADTKAEGEEPDTKARFAELAGTDAETRELLADLEDLVKEAEELDVDWHPYVSRHADEMAVAKTPNDVQFVLAQAIADMQAPMRKARILRDQR